MIRYSDENSMTPLQHLLIPELLSHQTSCLELMRPGNAKHLASYSGL